MKKKCHAVIGKCLIIILSSYLIDIYFTSYSWKDAYISSAIATFQLFIIVLIMGAAVKSTENE